MRAFLARFTGQGRSTKLAQENIGQHRATAPVLLARANPAGAAGEGSLKHRAGIGEDAVTKWARRARPARSASFLQAGAQRVIVPPRA